MEIFYLVVHSPDGLNTHVQVRLKLGTRNFFLIPPCTLRAQELGLTSAAFSCTVQEALPAGEQPRLILDANTPSGSLNCYTTIATPYLISVIFIYLFERHSKRERESFHNLVHSPNCCQVRVRPG